MKGYITNNKCYIFPQEAGQIPEVEASVFYVQQEDYVAWIEENESLADKISPYNYNVMTVQPKVWANHENDDLEPIEPTTYTITLTEGSDTYIQNPYPNPAEAGATVKIEPQGGYEPSNVDVTSSDVEISSGFDSELGIYDWWFTMPAADVTLTATPVVTNYTLTLAGTYSDGGPIVVTIDDEQAEGESPYTVPEGATVKFTNTQGAEGDFEWDPQLSIDGNGYYYIVMPAEDVTITINYTGGGSGPS